MSNAVVPAALLLPTAPGRCVCCDLPLNGCGTAALAALVESDPLTAAWLVDPAAGTGPAPSAYEVGIHVPLGQRVADLREALAY
jgi:hypothetical protein